MSGLPHSCLPSDGWRTESDLLQECCELRETANIQLGAFGAIFVRNSNKVLMVQLGDYARGKIGGNPWTLPGGAVGSGETPQQAVAREVLEECGVIVHADQLRLTAWIARPYVRQSNRVGEVTLLFTCQVDEQEPHSSPPETVDAGWFAFDFGVWMLVPSVGEGDPPQPLRRHWIYWTKMSHESLWTEQPQIVLYPNSDSMSLQPIKLA